MALVGIQPFGRQRRSAARVRRRCRGDGRRQEGAQRRGRMRVGLVGGGRVRKRCAPCQPANIMAAAANVFSFSGISVELVMLGVNVIVGVAYLIASRKEASSSVMRGIAVVGVIAGVVMTFVVGNGYVMQSQPNWNTALLPLAYTGSGLACGGALYCAIMAAFKEDIAEFKLVGVVAIVAIVIQLAACAAYGAVVASAIDAALYWGGCVGVGSVVALACAIFARKTPLAWWAVFAAALVGGIALRAAMWLAGTGFIDMFSLAAGRAVLGV